MGCAVTFDSDDDHMNTSYLRAPLWLLSASLLAGAPGAAWAQTPPPAVRPGAPITLNFVNADIEAVARAMASLSGRHVVVDPRVKGSLNLVTEKPVNASTALNQFASELRLRDYALVESDGIYKVVPAAEAKMQSATVLTEDRTPSGQQVVTQIIRLNHENANNLVPVLRPLISPNNTINVNPGNNALVITDFADNLRRIARIVAALDVSNATDVEVFPLQHALASDLVPVLQRLLEGEATMAAAGGNAPAATATYRTTLLAEPRSNAVVVRAATPARLALVKALVDKLDRPTASGGGDQIHVVYLKNADATEMAATLRAVLAAQGGAPVAAGAASTAARAPGAPAAASAPVAGPIQADVASNALVITAPEPLFRQLRRVIDRLDGRRAQVYVESLIAEVNADIASEFGVQWQGVIGNNGDGLIGLLGTNFGAAGGNILNLATQNGGQGQLPNPGLNLGALTRVNGVYTLGLLARFLETNGQGNILSTPNLLTLDNQEAKIVIGQNVPFVTGQYTNNNSNSGSVNPFQTIERRDVGLTLRVKPQVSENGTVRLTLFQEVSSVLASSINAPSGPVTNKRSIESSVLVEDGSIVVLGGLLQDEYGNNQDKVPGLGDVPLLGNLFRSESRSRKKTNLMVFLRPVVLRTAADSDTLAADRYDLMRSAQQHQQPAASRVHSVNSAPALPQLDLSNPDVPLRLLPLGQDMGILPVTPAAPAPAKAP